MNRSIHSFGFQKLAPGGFYIALRIGFAFPMAEKNAFPPEWVEIYTQRGLMIHDPVLKWAFSHSGAARWSEIGVSDPLGIMRQAAAFGMCYGAVVSYVGRCGGMRSYGTFAHGEREFDDAEIQTLSDAVKVLHDEADPPANLTKAELEVLRLMRDGLLMKQIADEIGVSLGAIKQRLKNAKLKLGARTSNQATALALEYGLL
uniref:LuxR family transcriptional regulator n=1 Tax=uncultured Rhodobacterales bacterium TaxID=293400 RepID=A0A0U1ZBX2_9RHOB|nr:LuxR family transcriptional regulator [uncultured Rhodobacterales bacterium]